MSNGGFSVCNTYDTSNIIGVIGPNGEQLAGGFHPDLFSSGRFSDFGLENYVGGQTSTASFPNFPQDMSDYSQYDGMSYGENPYSIPKNLYDNYHGISQGDITRLMGGVPSYERDIHQPQQPPPGQKEIPRYIFNYESETVTPMHTF